MRLRNLLVDPEQPISVIVKRQGEPTYNDLGELVPGQMDVVATTSQASLQPVSSATIQRESGRDVRSTHELYCPVLDCQADDEVEITFTKTDVVEHYTVNGRPQDWGTHLEVALVWLQS